MLKDKVLDRFLEDAGFCKLDFGTRDFLEPLKQIYETYYPDRGGEGFFVTHNSPVHEIASQVNERIKEIAAPLIAAHFEGYRIFAAHFVVKKARGNEGFQLHQDWNIVDEKRHRSIQIWIPLSVSYPENGGMGFVPGSHLFFDNIRSGTFDIPRVEVAPELYRYMSFLRLFPGEAALFFNQTFHCSFINSAPEDRVAVLINIVPEDAETVYYHSTPDQVEMYKIDTSSLFKNLHLLEKGQKPGDLELVSRMAYTQDNNTNINADLLISRLATLNQQEGRRPDYEYKMYPLLKDDQLEKQINHYGYAVIQLLTDAELELLRKQIDHYFPDRNIFKGRYSSMDSLPGEKTLEAHQSIQRIINGRLAQFFNDYYSPISIYYSKRPDGVLDIDWHSDPSFILNEHLEPMYGLWCTLNDIDSRHGSLKIIPGSHRMIYKLHGTYKTWVSPIEDKRRILDEFGIQFTLKAGQAVIYDTRMVHSSTPNYSDIERDCIVMRVNHAHTKHYFNITVDQVGDPSGEIYKQNKDYFFGNTAKDHVTQPDRGLPQGRYYIYPVTLSEEEIRTYLASFRE